MASIIKFNIFEKEFLNSGLTKAELARMLSVRPNALQGWFEREQVPNKYLYPVADALEVNPRFLLGETDDKTRMQTIPVLGNASETETCVSNLIPRSATKTIERKFYGNCVYAIYQDTESMKGTIEYGALCLCSPKSEVNINDIVHYTYGGKSGIARYRLSADKKTIVLAPDNKDFDPLFIGWDSETELKMVRIIRTEQDL